MTSEKDGAPPEELVGQLRITRLISHILAIHKGQN